MPRSYGDFAAVSIAALLVMCILIFSITMNSTTNVSAVEAKGVGVYWDSACSNRVSSIDWGTLIPGSVKSIVVYIRNEVEVPIYPIVSTTNWNPPKASDYITLRWDYTGQRMNPGETLKITLTLPVSRYIQGISSFSFDILVAGSDSLPGDVNGDGKVDYTDLWALGSAYGASYGEPRYDPRCDFNGDGKVDYEDLWILGSNYGKTD